MTPVRATALIGILCLSVVPYALPTFAQRDGTTESNAVQNEAASSNGQKQTDEITAVEAKFRLNRIGAGFGPELEHLQAAMRNTRITFAQLGEIRRRFWAADSDAERKVLRQAFAEALIEKDFQLLYGGVTTGSSGFLTTVYRQALDGGVPEAARPIFDRWVEAIRDHMGIREKQRYQQIENLKAFDLDRFRQAFKATRHFEDQYMLLRDWSEYQKAGRSQDFYPTPEAYVVYLQQVDGEPLSQTHAVARYRQLAAMFGDETLKKTANQQRVKPTDSDGVIRGSRMKPMYDYFEQVSQGSDAGFIFNQLRMIARSEDRWAEAISEFQEMISLIDAKVALAAASKARRDPNAQLADFVRALSESGDRECFLVNAARAKGMKWKVAGRQYEALCEIYGEDLVLKAASKVRIAKPLDPSKSYFDYYIKVPSELTIGDGAKSANSGITRDEAIALLLKREQRKTEVHGNLYDNATTTLSKDNMISSAMLPSKYTGGRIVADSNGVAFSVAGAPGASLFGLFGGNTKTNRVVVFSGDLNKRPTTIQNVEFDPFGKSMAMSREYVVVGDRKAWLSNPKTGRGPRLNAGEAYVYDRSTGKLVTNIRPPQDSLMPGLHFGAAVAAWDKFIAVGATGKRGQSEDEGEVNIYDVRSGEHQFRISLRPVDQAYKGFGAGIATDGKTLLVTAPGADKVSRLHPAAFLHKAEDGTLIARLESPGNGTERKEYGASIAVAGELAVVGSPRHRNGGAAFVYSSSTGKLRATLQNTATYQDTDDLGDSSHLRSLIVRAEQFDHGFGRAVSVSGDRIVIASTRSLHVFDSRTMQRIQTIPVGRDINSERIQLHDVAIAGKTIIATTRNGDGEDWTHHRVSLNETDTN
ncbi:MAG: hypothetical protein ISQ06_12260 [Planctomycetaceae bacterium]|nr:hypothetical protein [Planctomycetaceae bacterium]